MRKFSVDTTAGFDDSSVKFINFNFLNSSLGSSSVKITDDIRVTALFKTVAADVNVQKYAIIDDGKSEADLVNNGGGTKLSLVAADEYRNVDNSTFEDEDKRAVLFGDKLIYRMRVRNNGLYNASNVVVHDTVPDNCTLLPDSVKIYRQKKEIDKLMQKDDEYFELEDIGAKMSDSDSIDDMETEYENGRSLWRIDTSTDSDGKVTNDITWIINPVNAQYDYYVEYAVKVADDDYDKATEQLKNKADFTYSYINGECITTGNFNGTYNENYPTNASFNSTTAEKSEDGKITYTIAFTGKDANLKDYYIEHLSNDIPTGYSVVGGADGIEISSGNNKFKAELTSTGFKITPEDSNLIFDKGDGITVKFTIQKDSDSASERLQNVSRLFFYKPASEDENTSVLQSAITKVDSVTNEVVTDVRWLYLNLEKDVPADSDEEDYPFDNKQAFMFKLINDSVVSGSAMYTDLYADTDVKDKDSKTTAHKGSRLVQILERGDYTVSETDWAGTNYDLSKTTYSATDIDIKSDDLKTDNGITTADGASGYAKMYLPRAMYKSTAFPLWATEDDDGNIVYPTVTCTNYRSEYAWLTAENSVENNFVTDENLTTTILANIKQAAQNSNEDNETPVADVTVSGLAVVVEGKKEE
jgi:uncharacterized repeat protein (TIGR01451 family)